MTQFQIHGISSSAIYDAPRLTVQTKSTWAGTWITQPYLFPISWNREAAPNIGQAVFELNFGMVRPPDSTEKLIVPVDLKGRFVRIRVGNSYAMETAWIGYIASEQINLDSASATSTYSGVQQIVAFELSHLLDRTFINNGFVEVISGGASTVAEISYLPPFNKQFRVGSGINGNRSALLASTFTPAGEECYVFSDRFDILEDFRWTNLDIVDYLLAYHVPVGFPAITLGGQKGVLQSTVAEYDFNGRSVWECLCELINVRRGIGFSIVPTSDDDCSINAFSMFGESISYGSIVVPANGNQVSINLDSDPSIATNSVTINRANRFEKIVVAGEFIKSCFTLQFSDTNTLVPLWTEAAETSYKTLSHMVDTSMAALNDAERKTAPYERVYRAFGPALTWDWRVMNTDGSAYTCVNPTVSYNGTVTFPATSIPGWTFGKTFLNELPFLETVPTGMTPEYSRPLVFFTHNSKTYQLESLTEAVDLSFQGFSCGVRMLDSQLGLLLHPPINHMIAKGYFDTYEGTMQDPIIDCRTMIATVAMQTDERLRVTILTGAHSSASVRSTLFIDAPGNEYNVILPGTALSASDGLLTRQLELEVVRDDSENLREIAAVAAAWYGTDRSQIQVSLNRLAWVPGIGTYIISSGSAEHWNQVGTVVTSIRWDSMSQTTQFATSNAEINPVAVWQGSSGRRFESGLMKMARAIDALERRTCNLPVRFPTPTIGSSGGEGETIGALPRHSHLHNSDGGAGVLQISGDN